MHAADDPIDDAGTRPERSSAALIGVGTLMLLVLIGFHPIPHGENLSESMAEMARESRLSGGVHGGLILGLVLVSMGLSGLAARLGWRNCCVRAGAIAYGIGVMCTTGAALTGGFIVPGLARDLVGSSEAELEAQRPLMHLCHHVLSTLTEAGLIAICTGVFLWSLVLLRRTPSVRVAGIVGLIAGALPVAGLLTGHLHVGVHGIAAVLLVLAVWNVCVALWLARQRPS